MSEQTAVVRDNVSTCLFLEPDEIQRVRLFLGLSGKPPKWDIDLYFDFLEEKRDSITFSDLGILCDHHPWAISVMRGEIELSVVQ